MVHLLNSRWYSAGPRVPRLHWHYAGPCVPTVGWSYRIYVVGVRRCPDWAGALSGVLLVVLTLAVTRRHGGRRTKD